MIMSEPIENHRMQVEIPRDMLGPAGMFSTVQLFYLVMRLPGLDINLIQEDHILLMSRLKKNTVKSD